jgi:hypothetical protein
MYIYDEYKRFSAYFENVNEFIYKNRIYTIINYYNENIRINLKEYHSKVNYEYYKKYDLNAIEIIQSKSNDYYIPHYRLLTYNTIENNTFGVHRYGWKNVIFHFLNRNYSENTDFYFENPDFEWVSYAKEYNLYDYNSAIEHYLKNIQHKSLMKFNKIKYIIFDEWFERKYTWFKNKNKINDYKYNFISFNHDPVMYELPDDLHAEFKSKELKNIIEHNENFLNEKDNLRILITLSERQQKYIENNINLPKQTIVKTLYHPLELTTNKYNFDIKKFIENDNKKLYCIGWWLRKYDIFLKLSCNKTIIIKTVEGNHINKYIINELRKILKKKTDVNSFDYSSNKNELIEYINLNENENELTNDEYTLLNTEYNTEICDFMENEIYDKIFYNNIIFLDLYNCVANNIILECIMNNTPILVCFNKSITEYLGVDYPFYFTNYQDAEKKSKNLDLITKAHLYLRNMDKRKFTYEYFNNQMNKIIIENISTLH